MSARFLISVLLVLVVHNTSRAQQTEQSVLSQGEIYKLAVKQSGVYTISYSFLNETIGINPTSIDPRNIHIYANNGGFVPQLINDNRIDDLNELNIYVVGEEDGSFDPQDYILFYSEGADRYRLNKNELTFEKNIYDQSNYIFLKIDDQEGKRIANRDPLALGQYSTVKESVQRHEIDRLNLLGEFSGTQGSGKQWFGESFANNRDQNFGSSFNFENLVRGSDASIKALLTARSSQSSRFELTIDGQSFISNHSSTNTGDIEALYARSRLIEENITLNNENPSIQISFLPNAANSEGWLDYIEIIAQENNVFDGSPNFLVNRESLNNSTFGFSIESTTNPLIWDITDVSNITGQNYSRNGQNIEFDYEVSNALRAFIVFAESENYSQPEFISKIENQNLHAINRADFAIVYHPDFEEAAIRLANHRSQHDGLIVETVNINEIYNEFGGGKSDPTALRDFARMLYQRDDNFRYLLLFGDATYDFRHLNENIPNHNFVPTFQTLNSLNPIEAFPSDDFFALLTANEGDESLNGALDIGVGRIPCKSAEEAMAVVEKIIHYETHPLTLGEWKMNIGFSADDQDISIDRVHVSQSNEIAESTEIRFPEYHQQKVFFDAFTQVATPGGQRYPDANAALNENISKGQLVLSYLGHGGPKGWAQERVLQISDVQSWDNFNKLPIIITATCSFTGFDEPTFVSAGEVCLLNPIGGAIGLFTTVRAVYSSSNRRLTEEVYKKIFERQDGKRLRLGDIIRESQNANSLDTITSNSRKFMLMGDPSMTLGSHKYLINVDKLNGIAVEEGSVDTVGALEKGILEGSITDHLGNVITSFNGEVFLTVYDKEINRKTLDNDQIGTTYDFRLRNSVLYKGRATVTNGSFKINFIIPKDINFEYGNGYLSLYAHDGIINDAGGYYDQLVIGGVSDTALEDNEGPEIELFLENRSFQFGGRTSSDPLLIIDLNDENGINLSGTSIGHDITVAIDDKNGKQTILNDFFVPNVDELGSGTIEYQLNDITPGVHSLYVKAWDILNNSSESFTEFFVSDVEDEKLRNVYNYPNPFSTNTNFTFEHDLNSPNLDVLINIYTLSGRLIKSIQETKFSSGGRINDINWDGRDDFGNKLAKGVYVYKIKVSSSEFNLHRESDFQKLVILN